MMKIQHDEGIICWGSYMAGELNGKRTMQYRGYIVIGVMRDYTMGTK